MALAASRGSSDICGLILVSTAGRPLGEVLKEQLQSNPANAPILDQALSAIVRLQAGQQVDAASLHPALMPLFRPAVQDFLINAMSFDPAELIGGFHKPILILQGERDIQVSVTDARRLKAGNPRAELVLLPDTNHVLKTVTSNMRSSNVATYADPTLPLAAGVVTTIAGFVKASNR